MNASARAGGCASFIFDRLQGVSIPARKLFVVIVQQAYHGPIRPKPRGTALPAEILEACGLDVGDFYELLKALATAGLIRISNAYPFEEIQLSPDAAQVEALAERSRAGKIPLEEVFVNLVQPPGEDSSPAFDTFRVPPDERFFEDYTAGHVHEFGTITVTEEEIVEFARRFDPQYFHVDPAKAADSRFGGIIASGWHTASLTMRLYADHYLSHVASLASPGVDELRWPNPLRPGDTLKIRVTTLDTRGSRSKPDRGIVQARVETINQRDQVVLSMTAVSILARREVTAGPG
jgi:acyl dehydratase